MTQHEQWDIVSSIGLTALVVAASRSVDTHRADGLIQDPFAERFVDAADPAEPIPTRPPAPGDPAEGEAWFKMSSYVGMRTRYFDEFLLAAAAAGVRQVVVLAAGLDARAHRLAWPAGTRVFEIDQPAVLEFKDSVLGDELPTCDRVTVPMDLRGDWAAALTAAGFDAARPTAWLAEGLMFYLPQEAQAALLQTVTRLSAPGSSIAIETFANLTEVARRPDFDGTAQSLRMDLGGLIDGANEDAPSMLAAAGWRVDGDLADDMATAYGRPLVKRDEGLSVTGLFVRAAR